MGRLPTPLYGPGRGRGGQRPVGGRAAPATYSSTVESTPAVNPTPACPDLEGRPQYRRGDAQQPLRVGQVRQGIALPAPPPPGGTGCGACHQASTGRPNPLKGIHSEAARPHGDAVGSTPTSEASAGGLHRTGVGGVRRPAGERRLASVVAQGWPVAGAARPAVRPARKQIRTAGSPPVRGVGRVKSAARAERARVRSVPNTPAARHPTVTAKCSPTSRQLRVVNGRSRMPEITPHR